MIEDHAAAIRMKADSLHGFHGIDAESQNYFHRHADALAAQLSEAERYGAGRGTEIESLEERIKLLTQSNITKERQLAEAEARAGRLRELAREESDFSTALVDMMTDEQLDSPAYPIEHDRRVCELVRMCREHGDLPCDQPGEQQKRD